MKMISRLPAMRFWLLFTILGCLLAPKVMAAQTVVSLTFDDGYDDQLTAQSILDAAGFKGTFFINTGDINTSGELSTSDLLAMQAEGHEIAGHTINHLDLTTIPTSQQVTEICDDRSTLINDGLHVISFAYPYGSFNASAETVVKNCGYISGRIVGGLDCTDTISCQNTFAETIPPANAFTVQTPDSIVSTTTVTQIEQYVINAQNNATTTGKDGWLPIVFHHVCTGCDLYSVQTSTLTAFVSWLQGQVAASGGTLVVKTMAQVMGGDNTLAVPVINTLTPANVAAGSPATNLTVTGLNFTASSAVQWNGTVVGTTTFVNSTTLTIQVPATSLASVEIATVTVVNPGLGQTSPGMAFVVGNPLPVLTAITPAAANLNTAFTLTVVGSNFVSTSTVRVNGVTRTTTFVSSTTLKAAIPANAFTASGTATVVVFSPAPNGGTSAAQTLVVNPASGQICPCQIFPNTTIPNPGDANGETTSLELGVKFHPDVNGMITGLRFYKIAASTGTHVGHLWTSGGALLATVTYTGETASGWQTATLSPAVAVTANTTYVASYMTSSGYAITDNYLIAGEDNAPLHALSNSIDPDGVFGTGGTFPNQTAFSRNYWADVVFLNDLPTITSVSPNSALVGSSTATVTITGANFVSSSTVQLNGANKATTFVNNTTLTAVIPTSDLATVKVATITVLDLGLGGSTSNGLPFTVGYPVPTLISLSMSSVLVGSSSFTLTLNGTRFLSTGTVQSVIQWNGSPRTTTFVSSTTLRMVVPASDLAVGGNMAITVVNPAPGGGSSNSLNFAVGNPVPSIGSLSQSFANVDSTTTITLTISGINFIPTSVAQWNGSALFTTYLSSTALSAVIPTTDLNVIGISSITVSNPSPAGGISTPRFFSVVEGSGGGSSIGTLFPRVFPNPWKVTLHHSQPITFDRLPNGCTIKIFTTSARWVRTLSAPAGIATWDLKNDSGDAVASGYYIYLITDNSSDKVRGIIGIIR